jgi:hypothetical protein
MPLPCPPTPPFEFFLKKKIRMKREKGGVGKNFIS